MKGVVLCWLFLLKILKENMKVGIVMNHSKIKNLVGTETVSKIV